MSYFIMKKGWLISIGIVVIVLVLMGYFLFGLRIYPSTPKSDSISQENIVFIQGFQFNPPVINIKVGQSVSWVNRDSVLHSVYWDSQGMTNSPSFSNGDSYKYTFKVSGNYSYHCGIHTSMKGVVVVS